MGRRICHAEQLARPHLAAGGLPTVTDKVRVGAEPRPVTYPAAQPGATHRTANTGGLIASFAESEHWQRRETVPRTLLAHQGHDDHSMADAAAPRGGRAFPCTACGACCRNLSHSPIYADLDRGDGICRHLDIRTNLCRIYETRPKICRVTEMFEAFDGRLTWEEYVDLNLQSCRELRSVTYTQNQLGRSNACLSNT